MEFNEAFWQLRRIEEHRAKEFEQQIRRHYQEKLVELRHYMADAYARYARGDRLDFGVLQQHMVDARLLEEVTLRLNGLGAEVTKSIQTAVEEMYTLGYTGMAEAAALSRKGVPLVEAFKGAQGVSPEILRAAVENPIAGLTLSDRLERHRQDIIYNAKKAIGTGLAMGDTQGTMVKRISESLNGDYAKASRIVRTEVHRVQEAGHLEALKSAESGANAAGLYTTKTWRTMSDERVRPQRMYKAGGKWKRSRGGKANHMKMEGVSLRLEEEFDLGRGIKTQAPLQSGDAGNDINCRCFLEYGLEEVPESIKKLDVKGAKLAQNLDIEGELAMIPPKHLALAEKQVSGIEVVKGAQSSQYNPMTKTILISDKAEKGAVIHEVAHAIERELNLYDDPAFRKIWLDGLQDVGPEDIIEDNKTFTKTISRIENPKFISKYQGMLYESYGIFDGKTVSLEGLREYFSEGYREFLLNPQNLKRHDLFLFDFLEGLL